MIYIITDGMLAVSLIADDPGRTAGQRGKLDPMRQRQRANVDRGFVHMRDAPQMIESGRRELPTHVLDRRRGRVGHSSDLSRAAQYVDQVRCESVHVLQDAKMATTAQEQLCHNGICQNGIDQRVTSCMTINEIKTRMSERGFNQADLANLLGIDPTAVSKRLTGKRVFKHAEMIRIEAWLGGPTDTRTAGASAVRMVPIIGDVAAGNWKEAVQQPLGEMPVPGTAPVNAIALRVTGDSMNLEIDDGGTVIVDLDDKALFPGRLFVVLNDDNEATFKQFESDPARLVPRSTNPAHTVIQIGDGQSFTVLGRVTALYRSR